jgi:hypothetical protein
VIGSIVEPDFQENQMVREKKVVHEMSAALREQIQRGGAVPWQPSESGR